MSGKRQGVATHATTYHNDIFGNDPSNDRYMILAPKWLKLKQQSGTEQIICIKKMHILSKL